MPRRCVQISKSSALMMRYSLFESAGSKSLRKSGLLVWEYPLRFWSIRGWLPTILSNFKDAGLRAICMGIQANDRVNREHYHRPVSNERIIECQKVFCGGLPRIANIGRSFPTEQDKDELFHMLMELQRPFELYLFGLTIYPRTHLARTLLREGKLPRMTSVSEYHAFEQFRIDLNHPRPKADQRWLALIVLLNKNIFPKSFIWKLYHSEYFKEHPEFSSHLHR